VRAVDEIDVNNRLWTNPANRMKARKEHRVPRGGGRYRENGRSAESILSSWACAAAPLTTRP